MANIISMILHSLHFLKSPTGRYHGFQYCHDSALTYRSTALGWSMQASGGIFSVIPRPGVISSLIMWHLSYKYNLGGGLAPSSNKNEPPHRAHLKSLEPKMRTSTLLILPLLVASISAQSKQLFCKSFVCISIMVSKEYNFCPRCVCWY